MDVFAFVVPCSVTSDMHLLTGEIVVLLHVFSDVDTETFYRMACRGTLAQRRWGEKKTPQPSINVTLQQLKTGAKIFASFFRSLPSAPYSQGAFALHCNSNATTEVLSYTLIQG